MRSSLWQWLLHYWWRVSSAAEAALEQTYTGEILRAFWVLLAQLWYFVVVGALISTLVWRYLPKEWVRAELGRRVHGSIFAAALLGLVSPMCTFAAIPVVGTLIGMGVRPAPLVAFMVSSPLMNPALFVYTAGIIGPEMAVARVVTALATGLLGGYAAHHAVALGWLRFDVRAAAGVGSGSGPQSGPSPVRSGRGQAALLARRFASDLVFIARYFGLGILIAAMVQVLVSQETVVWVFGPSRAWAVPVAVALGVPLYACGGGSLPVVESMMRMGMTSNAALAFFIAGPATKISTLSVLGAVFGRRVLLFYLVVMLGSALCWGYVYPFRAEHLQLRPGSYAPAEQPFVR